MYTYKLLIFGHDISSDEELYDDMVQADINFSAKVGKIGDEELSFEVKTHYHGASDTTPYTFGIQITDDDNNPNYIKTVRALKEEDYMEMYENGLGQLIASLESDRGDSIEFDRFLDGLATFVKDNKPTFYAMEVSS